MGHKYKIRLTNKEVETICFLSDRGYCMAMWDALSDADTLTEDDVDDACTFYVPEHLAWPVQEEMENNGGHGFGPVDADLETKLQAFVAQIV